MKTRTIGIVVSIMLLQSLFFVSPVSAYRNSILDRVDTYYSRDYPGLSQAEFVLKMCEKIGASVIEGYAEEIVERCHRNGSTYGPTNDKHQRIIFFEEDENHLRAEIGRQN